MTVRWTVRPTPRPSRSETVAFAKQMTEGLSGGQTPSCAFLRTHFLFSFRKGNGFALPKEKRAGANRCPEFDSKDLRVYLKTPNVTGSEEFSRCARHFFAGILTYFKEK